MAKKTQTPRRAMERLGFKLPLMPTTLKAHFDGEQILLDEPADLPIGVPLLVTVLASQPDGAWHSLSQKALARAYDEDEPHYSWDDLK